MEEKIYVVTLYRHEDLEQFYDEMAANGFRLDLQRPLSRNTHYWMTAEQAEQLRQDERVWGVEAVDQFIIRRQAVVNNESYTKTGTFWKADTVGPATVGVNDFQWGHLHCAGNQTQRRKGTWGSGATSENVSDSVTIFNTGKHVDIVIVDDPISYDSEEWYSPSTNTTRFVQYQWFNELNSYVGSIDNDGQTLPTGTITYDTNATISQYHGNHVAGTAAGKHYGWAREANIYNMAVTDAWTSGQQFPALLIFDYLRAFHRNKAVNPATGKRNPTITNHSYGGIIPMPNGNLTFADLTAVQYQGTVYNSSNPGPSGWTEAGVTTDFGIRFGVEVYPFYSVAVGADVQDAINDGVVVIGAAGNDNLLFSTPTDVNWNNIMQVAGVGSFYYMRGGWPNSADIECINVGALSNLANFRRSVYSNHGPGINVFAPGDNILSAYNNTGLNDTKYTQGSGNYFYPISGTSMASPQVCGVIACLASGKERFTQQDAIGYLQRTSIVGDMTFNVSGGGYNDNSSQQGSPNRYLSAVNPRKTSGQIAEVKGQRRTSGQAFPRFSSFHQSLPAPVTYTYTFTVSTSGTSNYVISGTDKTTTHSSANDPTINCNAGDTLVFNLSASGHPFWIKTTNTTGTGNGVTTGTITPSNGRETGSLTWDTTGVAPGTYYYICQFHLSMVGQIIVS